MLPTIHAIWKDRQGDCGYGGVLAWIKNDIYRKRRVNFEVLNYEIFWLKLRLINVKIILGVIYRPPNVNTEWWDGFEDILINVKSLFDGLTGDLNCDPDTVKEKKII